MRIAYLKNYFTGQIDEIRTYTWEEFPYEKLSHTAITTGRHHKKETYLTNICTFDIESTTDETLKEAWMYHWQMCVDGICVYGRYWSEWESFLKELVKRQEVSKERRLAIYIQNMGYEFQFMKHFLERSFGGYTHFSPQKRKPLRVECENGLEFRCSWKLSNMSLEKFTQNEGGVSHQKAKGDLDYRICRTPMTPINDTEFGYCIADVLGLYEAIKHRLESEHDNLNTIPMTSTGYVRRDCRKAAAAQKGYRDMFHRNLLRKSVYELLKEAGRGGDTHASRYLSGRILEDLDCYDVQSSYPAMMLLKKFPMTAFQPYGEVETFDELSQLLDSKACLFRWTAVGVKVKETVGMPYIPDAKCRKIIKPVLDNGRVLESDGLSMTLTDIDYKIIKEQYDIEEEYIDDMHIAEYGPLPESIRMVVLEYYRRKCELKLQIQEAEKARDFEMATELNYLYGKAKNKLNGIFGMCYTDPVHGNIIILEDGSWKEEIPDLEEALQKYNSSRNSFLVYAWGIWVTCHARAHLKRLRDAAGEEYVAYQDTDSVKGHGLNKKAVALENQKIRQECDEKGAYIDLGSTRYYLGEYEEEKPYKHFKTLGAKKYAYEDSKGNLHVTVSGVAKETGAIELKTLDNFKLGFIFREAGGLELTYNEAEIHTITRNGETFETASNIAMCDSTYTLGITKGYEEIIGLDLWNI